MRCQTGTVGFEAHAAKDDEGHEGLPYHSPVQTLQHRPGPRRRKGLDSGLRVRHRLPRHRSRPRVVKAWHLGSGQDRGRMAGVGRESSDDGR